ncbi:MAG: DUF481 domain-containing protein [Bacteroidales bacterium]|nr:DUF481 domain-containing protein [Bacteroidales bacterium]
MNRIVILICILFLWAYSVNGQVDSLVFINGDDMVGEVKTMTRNVLMVKTKYSDKDFAIEWDGVKEIYTETYFLISLSDGRRYNGSLRSTEDGKVAIIIYIGNPIIVDIDDIVYLEDIDKGFWSRLSFTIDFGLDLTKANDFTQLSLRTSLGYKADRWSINSKYSNLYSRQNEIEDIWNSDGTIDFKYFMRKDLYPLANINFLSSSEQKLDLRTTSELGLGKFLTHSNNSYWGISVGGTYNIERYEHTEGKRESWEMFIGSELNLFNIGDLTLLNKVLVYRSFTETGRWRTDFNLDVKYEMFFDDDFYIILGTKVNYDNKPAEGASELDYTFHTGFGWEW